jgi:hypothetical protein
LFQLAVEYPCMHLQEQMGFRRAVAGNSHGLSDTNNHSTLIWGYISVARKNAINTFNEKRLTKGM